VDVDLLNKKVTSKVSKILENCFLTYFAAKCFLSELSDQIHAEFKENPSVALFDRYLDVLYKLGNPSDEFTLPTRLNRKRKLGDEEAIMEEESSEESSIVQVPSNIFKSTTKCTCQVAAISNFLLILSQTFGLWRKSDLSNYSFCLFCLSVKLQSNYELIAVYFQETDFGRSS